MYLRVFIEKNIWNFHFLHGIIDRYCGTSYPEKAVFNLTGECLIHALHCVREWLLFD